MLNNYPIFEKWYSTLNWILDKVEKLPKSVRFTISTKISNLALEIMETIIEMIYSKNKKPLLTKINLLLEKLRIYFRICSDRRYISLKQYEFISKALNETGKMTGGLLKSTL